MYLHANKLQGTLPSSLNKLTSLRIWYVIPSSISLMYWGRSMTTDFLVPFLIFSKIRMRQPFTSAKTIFQGSSPPPFTIWMNWPICTSKRTIWREPFLTKSNLWTAVFPFGISCSLHSGVVIGRRQPNKWYTPYRIRWMQEPARDRSLRQCPIRYAALAIGQFRVPGTTLSFR